MTDQFCLNYRARRKQNLDPKILLEKIKGRYEIRGNKFADIEKTYHPDIMENKKTYYDDLLTNKINISKFGLKSVKYTLLNKIEASFLFPK